MQHISAKFRIKHI